MKPGPRASFLLLVLAQACHSVEECSFRLYDRLAPARWISEMISDDRALGFAIGNGLLVLFGLLCWAVAFRREEAGRVVAWGWALVETANGTGHLLFAAAAGGYFPGAATAPLLLAAAGWLISALRASGIGLGGPASG